MLKLRKFISLLFGFLFAMNLVLLATNSAAQDKNPEKYGEVLGYNDVRELTSAGLLTFPGLGRSNYSENGTYSFTDEAKSITRFGVFDIRKDGRVCIDFFQNERHRCDIFLRKNSFVFLLTEEGDRFPVFFSLEGH
ncbi:MULTISPECIES: hypothetical protein [Falsihalocynthiibacter]|uniref:hypothetical protein n=1 Tax=Falsihalocynthiibacter TaxID=2854182 RepID=UPI003001F396